MDKYTFGKEQSVVNLVGNILLMPEYVIYQSKVARLLSRQMIALSAISTISNEAIRRTTLEMWHERFTSLVSGLPEIIRTHMRCFETGKYRQLLKKSYQKEDVMPKGRCIKCGRAYYGWSLKYHPQKCECGGDIELISREDNDGKEA